MKEEGLVVLCDNPFLSFGSEGLISDFRMHHLENTGKMVAQDFEKMLPQHFHGGIRTTDVFISYTPYTPGIMC